MNSAGSETASPEEAVPLEEVPVEEFREEEDAAEKPPGYDTLDFDENTLAAKAKELEQAYQGSFTVEAPPDYKQLFGEQAGKNKESGMQVCDRPRRPRVRPHTRSRRSRTEPSASNTTIGKVLDWIRRKLPRGANRLVVGLIVATILVVALALPFSMVVVGFSNLHICKASIVPIFLIVGGVALVAEVLLHTLLCMCQKWSHSRGENNDSTIRTLRICDCLAFFLFIWLLVGSNWVFRIGLYTSSSCTSGEQSGMGITNVVNENGTYTDVVVISEGLPSSDTTADCTDCDPGVYRFTVFTILIQYALGLCLVAACCSNVHHCSR